MTKPILMKKSTHVFLAVTSLAATLSACTLSAPPDCKNNEVRCFATDSLIKVCGSHSGKWGGHLKCDCSEETDLCENMPQCTQSEPECITVNSIAVSFSCKDGAYIPRVCGEPCSDDTSSCATDFEGTCDKKTAPSCIKTNNGVAMQIACSESGTWVMQYCEAGCAGNVCEIIKHEGSCQEGEPCNAANATSATCKNGKCVPNQCQDGYGDCDNDPETGCETNLSSIHKTSCNTCMKEYCEYNGDCHDPMTFSNTCGPECLNCNNPENNPHVKEGFGSCINAQCLANDCEAGYESNSTKCCKTDVNGVIDRNNTEECAIKCNDNYQWNGIKCCLQSEGYKVIKDEQETCSYICDEPKYHKDGELCISSASCTEGEQACIQAPDGHGTLRECNSTGNWIIVKPCLSDPNDPNSLPSSCKDDKTCGECINGTQTCQDIESNGFSIGQLKVCNSGVMKPVADEAQCTTSCNGMKCGDCINGKEQCTNAGTDGAIITCSNGVWDVSNKTPCTNNNSCNKAGTACGDCINGKEQCINDGTDGAMITCSDGAWDVSNKTPCTNNNSCNKAGTACGICKNGTIGCMPATYGPDQMYICENGSKKSTTNCELPNLNGRSIECGSTTPCIGACSDTTSCGSFKCPTTNHCLTLRFSDSSKYYYSCTSNKYTDNMTAIEKSYVDAACGSDCINCKDSKYNTIPNYATGVCSNTGTCTFECNSGYHVNSSGDACDPD